MAVLKGRNLDEIANHSNTVEICSCATFASWTLQYEPVTVTVDQILMRTGDTVSLCEHCIKAIQVSVCLEFTDDFQLQFLTITAIILKSVTSVYQIVI